MLKHTPRLRCRTNAAQEAIVLDIHTTEAHSSFVPAAQAGRPSGASDPLLDLIAAYKKGLADFNATDFEDGEDTAVMAITFGPPCEAIKAYDRPARTREGAAAALALALHEWDTCGHCEGFQESLVRAALGYLKAEA